MSFVLQRSGAISYRIYDSAGKLLIHDTEEMIAGKHVLSVRMGEKSIDGLYVVVFEAEGQIQTQKMILK